LCGGSAVGTGIVTTGIVVGNVAGGSVTGIVTGNDTGGVTGLVTAGYGMVCASTFAAWAQMGTARGGRPKVLLRLAAMALIKALFTSGVGIP
jgi:hypothetical protein